jgi:hypothetical protein
MSKYPYWLVSRFVQKATNPSSQKGPAGMERGQYRSADVGQLTNKLIYEQLPPGVLEDLRRKNPVDPATKRRKRKHYYWLTEDVGNPHVDRQIASVITLLRATPNGQWKFFEMLFSHAFAPAQPNLFWQRKSRG